MRKTNFLFDGLKTFVEQVGVVGIVATTGYLVLHSRLSLGDIMFYVLLLHNVTALIRQLHQMCDELNEVHTYSAAFFTLLEADDAVEVSGPVPADALTGTFELRHVHFSYPNGTVALHDVSLTIEAGQTTALVGLSGAGKSTVINLLCRFYEPRSGEILLDGRPLADYDLHALRRHIGLVLQKNHIFKGTIEENIRYGWSMPASSRCSRPPARPSCTSRFCCYTTSTIPLPSNFRAASSSASPSPGSSSKTRPSSSSTRQPPASTP
jgi:ABC-type bacteriocin/lantibiotic exporter with double-glycine peptidase domain